MKKNSRINVVSISFVLILLTAGCHHENRTQYIRTKGSDTMLILMRQWAEEYMNKYKDVSIYVEGGGSALGIRALINNEIDICAASRTMLPG